MRSELICEACGARQFTRKGMYCICEYCGSKLLIEKDHTSDKLLSDSHTDA